MQTAEQTHNSHESENHPSLSSESQLMKVTDDSSLFLHVPAP